MATSEQTAPTSRAGGLPWWRDRTARRLTVGTILGLTVLVGVPLWRMRSLDGLPDVGDPFDMAEARRTIVIPDKDNAIVAYWAAHAELWRGWQSVDPAGRDIISGAVGDEKDDQLDWSTAMPVARNALKTMGPALAIWKKGSERPDALYHQPAEVTPSTLLTLVQDAIICAGLAALEGSRVDASGQPEDAWEWYRALLRSSRLIGRHGFLVQRCYGAKIHALATRRILRWAADPRVGTTALRRALDDTLKADALTPPVSEAVRIDYLSFLSIIDDWAEFQNAMRGYGQGFSITGGRQEGALDQMLPPNVYWSIHRTRLHVRNDFERSRRIIRLIFANWLAQVDRPEGRRAPVAIRKPVWLYAEDPSAPPAARAVSPEFLAEEIRHTEIARFWTDPQPDRQSPTPGDMIGLPWEGKGYLAAERRRRSVLIVRLAAEVYRREHGAAPQKAGAVVGTVLDELPEGIDADDPVPDGLE